MAALFEVVAETTADEVLARRELLLVHRGGGSDVDGVAALPPSPRVGQSWSPAVADIIGARRACTVAMILGVDALQVDAGRAEVWRARAGAG
jgi:hypothetical protein